MHVGVVGLGLIGGSIGLGLRRAGAFVTGFDVDPHTCRRALERGAVAEVVPNVGWVARSAALVVVATPVDATAGVCGALASTTGPAVTDVGSTKSAVVAAAEARLGGRFLGGHPIAGSERHGIEAAAEDLFEGAPWALTPTEDTESAVVERVGELVEVLGATPVVVGADEHDRLVARLSHLPQVAASTLIDVAAASAEATAVAGLAGPGFRDATRVAGSNPELWVAILRSNRDAVRAALDEVIERLAHVGELLDGGRWDDLQAWLGGARAARSELFAKRGWAPRPPVRLVLTVPDRPGVLAEVTAAAARVGANIEDLEIVHSPEGGRGRLQLAVDAGVAEELSEALAALGYRAGWGEEALEA